MVCSEYMYSSKHASYTLLLALSVFFAPLAPVFNAHAQEACGSIFDLFGGVETITSCTDPFHKTTDLVSPYTLYINDLPVTDGGIVKVLPGGSNNYRTEGNSFLPGVNIIFYQHDGLDYRAIDTNALGKTEADYRRLAEAYFSPDVDREAYVQAAIIRDDGSYDEAFRNTLYGFLDYVDANFVYVSPALRAGTYTLVYTEYDFILVQRSFIEKIIDWIVPTAFAQVTYRQNIFTLTFTIVEEEPQPLGASSVLFLPGIQASRLYKDGLLGTEDQVWEPNGNQDLRQISMSESGVSDNAIYTRDIMGEIFGITNVYLGFSRFMDGLVADGIIQNWRSFAYDWRYSVVDVADSGTAYENEIKDAVAEIERLAQDSFSEKVTLVGHSNGGLVTKAVMQRLEREGKTGLVDRVVFLATPQLGTPEAIGTILHGYDQEKFGGLLIADEVARGVIKNLPGAYGLVPTQAYFNATQNPKISFDTSPATLSFRNAYGNTIDSESELIEFMSGQTDARPSAQTAYEAGLANRSMLERALAQHRTALDSWVAPDGVEVFEVVGVGLNTVSGFQYTGFTERICTDPDLFGNRTCTSKEIYKPKPTISQYGDKTVGANSAEGYQGTKETYYIDLDASDNAEGAFAVEHLNFTENPSIQTLLRNILEEATTTDIQFISKTKPSFNTEKVILGTHSPVTIEVTDSTGRKAGRTTSGAGNIPQSREDIPGSSYFELGGSKYIVLPANLTYDVTIVGTDEGGLTFTLDALHGDIQEPKVSVAVATITASTTIKLAYDNQQISNLFIDTNKDGLTDIEMTPTGEVVLPVVTYSMLNQALNNLPLTKARKTPLLTLASVAEAFDKKSKKHKSFALLEQITLSQLDQTLRLYVRKGWLTQAQATPVITLVDKVN